MAENQPNVLVFISDQHHPDVLGCAGDKLDPTPNLDKLAARGTRFTNCHCAFPLCGPSRMSFMTGRYPHEIDCLTNTCQLRSDMPTFAHGFNRAGYDTAIAGRMHFVGHDHMHGFHERIVSDCSPTAYIGPHNGWRLLEVLGPLLRQAPGMGPKPLLISGPGEQGYLEYDKRMVDKSIDWLRNRAKQKSDKPFMLTSGGVLPHCPFVAHPDDFYRFYEQISVDDLPDPRLDVLCSAVAKLRAKYNLPDERVTKETERVVRAAYYGMVAAMDRHIGRLMQALEETGLADNTIVLYTSDHGEALGEHGMWWKQTFYRGSVGVPLIVAQPGQANGGTTVDKNVNLIDIGSTLIDMVGGEQLKHVTGRSFRKLAETGSDESWNDVTYSEFVDAKLREPGRMVKKGPWKLMNYFNNDPVLYNLDEDPDEVVDRAKDPACKAIVDELLALSTSDGWDPNRINRMLDILGEGQSLFSQWCGKVEPAEPHAPWHDGDLPENRIDDIPGSSHEVYREVPANSPKY